MKDLQELIKDIHKTAVDHGFWDKEKSLGDVLSLIHSEVSEGLEFERNKNNLKNIKIDYQHHYTGKIKAEDIRKAFNLPDDVAVEPALILSNTPTEMCKKPDGLLPELADVVIRVFDYVGSIGKGDDFVKIILEKHEFNKTRPYMHGGKTL